MGRMWAWFGRGYRPRPLTRVTPTLWTLTAKDCSLTLPVPDDVTVVADVDRPHLRGHIAPGVGRSAHGPVTDPCAVRQRIWAGR